jgi:hypothetical protein
MVVMVRLITKRLSDGSHVHNVLFDRTTLHAISEEAAHELMRDLRSAVHSYTVDEVSRGDDMLTGE